MKPIQDEQVRVRELYEATADMKGRPPEEKVLVLVLTTIGKWRTFPENVAKYHDALLRIQYDEPLSYATKGDRSKLAKDLPHVANALVEVFGQLEDSLKKGLPLQGVGLRLGFEHEERPPGIG